MRQDFEQLFSRINPPEPPAGFSDRIFAAISGEDKRKKRKRVLLSIFGAAFSLAAFIPAATVAFFNLKNSGFLQYASLVFSDGGAVADAGMQYIFALLESIPAASLGTSLFMAATLAFFINRIKINRIIYG